MKLHLGCGRKYREGWINADVNRNVKADYYFDMNDKFPFEDNYFDEIYMDSVLEHSNDIVKVLKELYRVCKPNARMEIWAPHYSATGAMKILFHNYYFGIGTLDFGNYENDTGEKQDFEFEVLEEKLCLFGKEYKGIMNFLLFFNNFNFLFNFTRTWKLFCEKYFPLRFEEIQYILEVRK